MRRGRGNAFDGADLVVTATNPDGAFDATGLLPDTFRGIESTPANNVPERRPSSLGGRSVAFGSSFRIVGADTDGPNLRVKPRPDAGSAGYRQLAVGQGRRIAPSSWGLRRAGSAPEPPRADGPSAQGCARGVGRARAVG